MSLQQGCPVLLLRTPGSHEITIYHSTCFGCITFHPGLGTKK